MELNNKKIIQIDLSASDNIIYTNEQIIHKEELDKVEYLIKSRLSKIEQYECKENRQENCIIKSKQPVHDSILIEGARGSGKTSFLNSLWYNLTKPHYDDYLKLAIFDILDPTLIEEKSHFFITVLSLIKNMVYAKLDSDNNSIEYLSNKEALEKSLERLARGLPSIDESISTPNYWDDASQILNKGLNDVSSSFCLRNNFNDFLDTSLKILGKKAFVLLIDDVDITFSKTWPILETIRKYLCTEKIIVIVSGNFELFSTAIRKVQWENFGKGLLKNEYDTNINNELANLKSNFRSYVSNLEDQYLQKIFKVQYRIKLRNIHDIIDSDRFITLTKDDKNISYDFLLRILFRQICMVSNYELTSYIQFLQTTSIRTQINFFQTINIDKNKDINFDKTTSILEPFISEIINNNINYENLINSDYFLSIEILKFLVNNNCLTDCYQLSPINQSKSINTCLYALSLYLAFRFKHTPILLFDYAIRIVYLYNIANSYFNENESKTSYIKKIIKHAKLYNDVSLRNISCYINSYICTDKKIINGTLNVKRDFENRVKKLKIDNTCKQIIMLPFFIVSQTNKSNKYSIFTLLASIAELIRITSSDYRIDNDGTIINALTILSEPKYFPTYGGSASEADNDSNPKSENEDEEYNDDSTTSLKLIESIQTWIQVLKKIDISVPPYIVAKIISRAYSSFASINPEYKTIGDYMNLFVMNLFNAALIEEFNEFESVYSNKIRENKVGIIKKNINTKNSVFFNNLTKLKNILESSSFSKYKMEDNQYINAVYTSIYYGQKTTDFTSITLPNNFFSVTKLLLTCPLLLVFLNHGDSESEDTKDNLIILKEVDRILLKQTQTSKNKIESFINNTFSTDIYKSLSQISIV